MENVERNQGQSLWSLLADIGGGILSIIKGHIITFKTLWRPKVTDQYPHRDTRKDWHPGPGYRGDFALLGDEERPGGLRCIACMACANTCPTGCIHITGEGKGKERHPSAFYVDIGLCMYCWMCVEACPVAAITMTPEYHNVSYTPEGLIRNLEDLRARGLSIPEPLVPGPREHTTLRAAPKKKEPKAAPAKDAGAKPEGKAKAEPKAKPEAEAGSEAAAKPAAKSDSEAEAKPKAEAEPKGESAAKAESEDGEQQ